MNQTKTVLHRNKRLSSFINSPTFRYQHMLIMLLFVSATLIFLDLGLFSASFIFGTGLIFITMLGKPILLKPQGSMRFLFAFLLLALVSLFFAEGAIGFRELKLYIQTIYWFLLAVIVHNLYPLLDKQKLSKYILFSTFLLLMLYVSGFRSGLTQNSVAFSVIILAPMSFFYLKKTWIKIGFAGLLVFLILLGGSRSGAIISFVQCVLIILFSFNTFRRYIKTFLVVLVVLITLFTSETTLSILGNIVYPYNPRVGELLTNTKHVMRNDMSWLQRQAQIQKGKQIFAEHPILGIGYTKFTEYDIVIDESQIDTDRVLRNIDNRSSHNTYVSWLAETGILGLSTMVLFFLFILVSFWKTLHLLPGHFESTLLISLLGMLIYFYTITAHLGTSTWIMYGLIAGAANQLNNYKKRNLSVTR